MKQGHLLILILLCLSTVMAEQILEMDFKPLFSKKSWPIVSKGFDDGSVTVENEIFVKSPPSLKIDCSRSKEKIVSVTFYLIRKDFEIFRGKTVSFKAKIKRLSGAEKPYVQVRFRHLDEKGNYQYLFGKSQSFEISNSDWSDIIFTCDIPSQANVNAVDFQIYVTNTSNPTVLIIDECSLIENISKELSDNRQEDRAPPEVSWLQNSTSPLEIVKDSKPVAVIVTETNPTKTTQYAVKELNEHIKLSTGTYLNVVNDEENISGPAIHIGKTKLSVQLGFSPELLPPDTWVIKRVGNAIVISGGDNNFNASPVGKDLVPFGTLYATYEFLERVLGVRWFWPGDDGRLVPEHKNIVVGSISLQGFPSYDTRFAFYAIPEGISSEDTWIWWRRMRWGGTGGNPIGMHSFTQWNEKYGSQHPEWFALQINGERLNTVDPDKRKNGHLCYSNPEVINAVVKEAREFFDRFPERKYFAVMPGDSNELYYCQCKNCQALVNPDQPKGKTHSYAIWSFVNKVASEIRKTHPDRFITCCAYGGYRIPPDNLYFEPNVVVTFCVPDELQNVWTADFKTRYVSEITKWKRIVPDIYVWDYWLYRWKPGLYGAPAIFPHLLQDIYLLEHGRVRGHVIELCNKDSSGILHNFWQDWMMDQINVYIGFRLLWNSETDVDTLLKEYYQFFGPAEQLIQKFYETMENAFLNPATKGKELTWNWDTCWQRTYTPELVNQVMGYLKEAEKLTRGNEPYHTRVEKVLNGFLPFELASKKFSGSSASSIEKNKNIVVPRVSVAPEIDGNLNEKVWEKAVRLNNFVDLYNTPTIARTEFLLLHDGKNFYIAIRAYLPDNVFKKTTHPGTVDSTIWDTESCEIFFAPDKNCCYQFLIGPENNFTDLFVPDIKKFSLENLKWNAKGIEYATNIQKELWIAELKIPFSAIKYDSTSKWRVNFCRNYYFHKDMEKGQEKWVHEASSWLPVFGSFYNIDSFGFINTGD